MAIDRRNYSNVPDDILSSVLLMDAGLARLIQREVEAKGLFQDISFLEAREKLVEYSFQLDDEEETDDMLEDDYSGRRTHFADRLKSEIGDYLSRFSERERRILFKTGIANTPRGNRKIQSLIVDCESYMPHADEETNVNLEDVSFRSRLASFVRRFYRTN